MREGWTYKKFAEVFDLQMGKTPSRDNPLFWNGQNTWVSIADLQHKYIGSSKEKITEKAVSESNIKIVKKGTVIMSFKLTVGRCAIAAKDLYTNEAIMSFTPLRDGVLLPEFIYYNLKGYKWLGANKAVMGMTLNKKSISSNVFAYPPLSEQERIVSELDLLSSIIEKKRAQLKEYDQLAQSIFYDMFGDPVSNEKGWEVKKLGEVCIIERGGSPRPIEHYLTDDVNGINWIKIGDATEGGMVISSTKQRIIPEGIKKSRFVHKGDFLLSNSMSFGKPYILGVDGCIHDGWLVIQDTNQTFNKIYLYYFLGNPQTYESFKSMAVGGVVNNLNTEMVKKVYVSIPDAQIQQSFAEKIETIEKQKELIKQSITETETLFNSRMDYFFN